ncbi:uncharacterized protein JN550_002353 [Neoarthrinium moseri]|uniref:uncharacterized protein n=1 Tax=Neoarthrinium moseri TaxID=1658444 RepID=UPI001FDC6D77|nr:uncharacterized protein JN550_002353 [Neoarthrinium moseri]KAI1874924.1 hypothetical protein JN550_002353 [Neoarthrinium moseri]
MPNWTARLPFRRGTNTAYQASMADSCDPTESCFPQNTPSSAAAGPSILKKGSKISIPQIIITLDPSDENDGHCKSKFIDIIPATERPMYIVTYNGGEYHRIRPTPIQSQDPFIHASPNKRLAASIESGSLKTGICRISECEYCNLCDRFNIDAFAEQKALLGESNLWNDWDPYFHWIMNEQIPHFGDDNLGSGSKKTGPCWISDCETCSAEDRETLSNEECNCSRNKKSLTIKCICRHRQPYHGCRAVTKGVRKVPAFPSRLCTIPANRPNGKCTHCKEMNYLLSSLHKGGHSITDFTDMEKFHNHILLRRLAFALSPKAARPSDVGPLTFNHVFGVVTFDLPSPVPKSVVFSIDYDARIYHRKSQWKPARDPSPYPRMAKAVDERGDGMRGRSVTFKLLPQLSDEEQRGRASTRTAVRSRKATPHPKVARGGLIPRPMLRDEPLGRPSFLKRRSSCPGPFPKKPRPTTGYLELTVAGSSTIPHTHSSPPTPGFTYIPKDTASTITRSPPTPGFTFISNDGSIRETAAFSSLAEWDGQDYDNSHGQDQGQASTNTDDLPEVPEPSFFKKCLILLQVIDNPMVCKGCELDIHACECSQ